MERDRQSWQHRLSPSVRSARSPHSKISLGERKAKYIIANDASPRVAECWASGERTGGIYGQDPGGKRERGMRGERERVSEPDCEESSPRKSVLLVCLYMQAHQRLTGNGF